MPDSGTFEIPGRHLDPAKLIRDLMSSVDICVRLELISAFYGEHLLVIITFFGPHES